MLPPLHLSFDNYGEWKIDKISVNVHSLNFAQIIYEKYERNATTNIVDVWLNPIDRIRDISLEDKIHRKLSKLKNKLKKENETIRMCKELSKKFDNKR